MEDAALALVDFRAGQAFLLGNRRQLDFPSVPFFRQLDFLEVQSWLGGQSLWRFKSRVLELRRARISRRQEVVCFLAAQERKECKDAAKGSFCVHCVLLRLKFLEHPCSAGCVMNFGTSLARNFRGSWTTGQGQSSQAMDLASAPGRDRTFDLRIRNPWRPLENQGLAEGVTVL